MSPRRDPPDPVTIYLDSHACAVVRGDFHPCGFVLPRHTCMAVERGAANAALLGFHAVLCTEGQAKELAEYFGLAALVFRMTGDARATGCTRAFEATRRALA